MKVLQLCVGNKLFVGVGVGHSVYSGSIIIIDTTDYYFQGCDHILCRIIYN